MTCIGCSDRDRTYTWADVDAMQRRRSPLEVEYIKAQQEAERLWKQHCQSVDMWVENRMYETMDAHEELCKQADLKAHILYTRINGVNVEDGE